MTNFRKKNPLLYTLFIMATLLSSMPFITAQTRNLTVQRIWDQAPHNAFTDLIFHKGRFYCAFREGSGHIPGETGSDGKIRILTSSNGKTWTSLTLIEKEDYDLRDPKISITPDGRIMVLMGATDYHGKTAMGLFPHVCFSDKEGNIFSPPQQVFIDEVIRSRWDWLWRVTWKNKTGYGIVYQSPRGEPSIISLLKTEDGINYKLVQTFNIEGSPNEATIRFMPDEEMLILLRREGADKMGYLGRSTFPYDTWKWEDIGMRLGGPNFINIPHKEETFIYATRVYSQDGVYTGIFDGNRSGIHTELFKLPSGGDTSYPGLVFRKRHLYISYYSSHEGKTSIYLARIHKKALTSK